MTDKAITLSNGKQVTLDNEINVRMPGGQYGGRIGFVGDLVTSLAYYRERVTERLDATRVIDAVKSMLEAERQLDLKHSYQGILNMFQGYVTHGREHSIIKAEELCSERSPEFQTAFERALTESQSFGYDLLPPARIRESLAHLIHAAEAYLVILSIWFRASTVLSPSTVQDETTIRDLILDAVQSLKRKIGYTLLPGRTVKRSPIGALLLRGDNNFLQYQQFCEGYEGHEGILKMVAEANEADKRDHPYTYSASKEHRYAHHLHVVDIYIELLNSFEALLEIRLSFDPSAKPDGEAAASTTPEGEKMLALPDGPRY
ncbi:hypothetical protein Pfra02_00670 [Pseudomonas fragi]|nr:hypothetical protein Pfra02_00670 [Pseudomonas fragi]